MRSSCSSSGITRGVCRARKAMEPSEAAAMMPGGAAIAATGSCRVQLLESACHFISAEGPVIVPHVLMMAGQATAQPG
jgi:hypothetical protein